jgi:hypothetical protein
MQSNLAEPRSAFRLSPTPAILASCRIIFATVFLVLMTVDGGRRCAFAPYAA